MKVNQPFLLGLVHQVRDTFEKPRDFTYGQPNFVQSHSTQWHHNQPQSQSRKTWQLNKINRNQLASSKKIKYLTNYVKLNQFHKLLDTKGFFTLVKSNKYQANSHLQYCQRLSLTVKQHLGKRYNDKHFSN